MGQLPVSVDRIREGLGREPAFRLDGLPVFSLTINERRPRYWDLQSPFLFKVEPRTSTTRWHDEFQAMVTPDEARLYSPMLSPSETATIAATSLLFAGAASLLKAGFSEWKQGRREGRARAAVAEVDAALAAPGALGERQQVSSKPTASDLLSLNTGSVGRRSVSGARTPGCGACGDGAPAPTCRTRAFRRARRPARRRGA